MISFGTARCRPIRGNLAGLPLVGLIRWDDPRDARRCTDLDDREHQHPPVLHRVFVEPEPATKLSHRLWSGGALYVPQCDHELVRTVDEADSGPGPA